ncbi:hypothetical protein [Streptomyces sp. NPDC050564]|uniref:MmyB family transcriptional regulator n=1 Tax=Streptomyces sp. NPDC050564 TaxID=3365631 RepID=UPI0037A193EC
MQGSTHGRKTFHHPEVGDLTLGYQSMKLEGTPGHCLIAYFAEPGTPEYDTLVLLDLLASEASSNGAAPAGGPPQTTRSGSPAP